VECAAFVSEFYVLHKNPTQAVTVSGNDRSSESVHQKMIDFADFTKK